MWALRDLGALTRRSSSLLKVLLNNFGGKLLNSSLELVKNGLMITPLQWAKTERGRWKTKEEEREREDERGCKKKSGKVSESAIVKDAHRAACSSADNEHRLNNFLAL